jgi:hypothetical protein
LISSSLSYLVSSKSNSTLPQSSNIFTEFSSSSPNQLSNKNTENTSLLRSSSLKKNKDLYPQPESILLSSPFAIFPPLITSPKYSQTSPSIFNTSPRESSTLSSQITKHKSIVVIHLIFH